MDPKLKEDFTQFCDYIGLSVSAVITAYAKKVVQTQSIPFKFERPKPNKETILAMKELEDMEKNPDKYKSYSNVHSMIEEILSEWSYMSKYIVKTTKQFERDLKKIAKRGYKIELLEEVILKLSEGQKLDVKHRDHKLTSNEGLRECHITPDWLLTYKYFDNYLYLYLMRTGTHSDLFDWNLR